MNHRIKQAALIALTTFTIHHSATAETGTDSSPPPEDARTRWLLRTFHDAASRHVMVVAHRGDSHDAPENSLAGIANCIAMGVDAVEIDLRKTKDGHYVLMHDKTADRTTSGAGRIDEMTLAEATALRLRDTSGNLTDQTVPTLEQALELSRGKVLVYLDKTDDAIDDVQARVRAVRAEPMVMYYGKRPLAAFRKRYPDLVGKINYLPKVGDDTPDMAGYVADLSTLKPAAFVLDFAREDSAVLASIPAMRKSGARIWASPLWPEATAGRTDERALTDPDANWGWLLEQGVSVFCTDRPKELLAYLRHKGLRDREGDQLSLNPTPAADR